MMRTWAPAGSLPGVPLGMVMTSHSLVSAMGSLFSMGKRPSCALFGGHGFIFAGERGQQGVPGKRGAFDADGKFGHAAENRQLAHIAGAGSGIHPASHKAMKLLENLLHLGLGFA